jgi:hypothetical protein
VGEGRASVDARKAAMIAAGEGHPDDLWITWVIVRPPQLDEAAEARLRDAVAGAAPRPNPYADMRGPERRAGPEANKPSTHHLET